MVLVADFTIWSLGLLPLACTKNEYALPVAVANQRNLSKRASSLADTKNNEWRCSIIISLVSKFLVLKKPDLKCSINF